MTTATIDWHARSAALTLDGRALIGGERHPALAGESFDCVSPIDGRVLGRVARGQTADIDAAVASARTAFDDGRWSRRPPAARKRVLLAFAEKILAAKEELALLETLDMGKPIQYSLSVDVPSTARCIAWYAEAVDKIYDEIAPTPDSALALITREPMGVIGAIVPWNYPMIMAAWKLGPALAAGNSVVLKPAQLSPLSATLLAQLFMEAGGPAGVFNVVHGTGGTVGKALALHMDVDKISFTGSTEVGKLMMVYAGQSNMKRVTTECGGKTPQIITGDVPDLDTAVQYAVNGIYGNQGEVCNAGSRLIVDAKIHDEFVSKFLEKAKKSFSPGDPLDPSTTMGPLVTKEQQKRVLSYIDIGKKEGAKLAMGGATPKGLDKGCYVSPTLFTGVKNDMRIAKEEIFGPVTGVLTYKKLDDAIAMANDSIYGLAASIWTSDVSVAHKAARDIEAGIVWVNCFDHGDMTSIWGGFKQSGMGRDKCLETLTTVTQTKSVWMHLG